ncbi:DUF11 domain-containing protein [Zavarzinella formosa]|uniref:DUF11 domain-containing protein n=1 Tax=Zavarzinella formosa TaxID=360055 RepID=UPI0002FA8D93|nr:DUF11 domain-containing protein [Zavarzinella formosa]
MNISLLALALTVAQPGPNVGVPPVPVYPPAPFLFVKVNGPKGTDVTYHPATPQAVTTSDPVGLKPGYPYRLQLSNIPDHKDVAFYPSIEVRGILSHRPGFYPVKHPVPIIFTEQDIQKVSEGKMITKIYYLESPDKALPVPSDPNEPLEFLAESEAEAIKEARERGRPMLIVRLGERPFTKNELARENVPATIYFPALQNNPTPPIPPMFAFTLVQPFDPILGPKGCDAECLHDGGDSGARMGVGPDGKLRGLDPSDTAMQYTTPRGSKVSPSNRVSLCVPRFVAARIETGTAGHHMVQNPEQGISIRPVAGLGGRTIVTQAANLEQVGAVKADQRASGMESKIGPGILDQWSGAPKGLANVQGTLVAAQITGPDEISSVPSHQFMIAKSVDPANADRIGQEVTFYLRFSNPTNEVMTNVIINDSLTARLEYVEGSAKSSRPSTFTNQGNEAGSSLLKWVLDGKLLPGEFGVISFKAKIK